MSNVIKTNNNTNKTTMKELMMIFVGGDYEQSELSPDQIQSRLAKWNQWVDDLKKDDNFINGRALKPRAVSVGEGHVVTDGAYVETKELVTGYFLLKANNLEQVIEMSKDFPEYDIGGTVQIREIENFE